MNWTPIAQASIEGDSHVNEDTAGHAGRIAWIIDGATPLWPGIGLPGASDPSWYAQELGRLLRDTDLERVETTVRHDAGVPALPPEGVVARGVLRDALVRMDVLAETLVGSERESFPSAAVTVAVTMPDGVELVALADCQAVVLGPCESGQESHAGPALARWHHFGVGTWDRSRGPQTSLASRPVDRKAQLIQERRDRNLPGSVWVARRESEAADHAHAVFFPEATSVVLASDGAWRAVELGLTGVSEFARRAHSQPELTNLLAELRNTQEAQGEVADDTTVISLSVV